MTEDRSRASVRRTKPGICCDKAEACFSLDDIWSSVIVTFICIFDASFFVSPGGAGAFAPASLKAARTTPKNSSPTLKTFLLLHALPFHTYPTHMLATGPALLKMICNGSEILYSNAALFKTLITTNCAAKIHHCANGTFRLLSRGIQTVWVGCSGGGCGGEVTVNVSCDGRVYSVIARNWSKVIRVPVDEDSVSIDSRV